MKVFQFLTISVVVCETLHESDGPKVSDELSSTAVRPLKFVVF